MSSNEIEINREVGTKKNNKTSMPLNYLFINNLIIFSMTFIVIVGFVGVTIWDFIPALGNMVKEFITNIKYYPLLVVIIPIFGGLISGYIGKKSEKIRDCISSISSFITFLMVIGMYFVVVEENIILSLPNVMGLGLLFRIDMFSLALAILTSIIWLLVIIYAPDYMKHEGHRNRFSMFMGITYGAILGTLMSGDIFTLFWFFEIMTFSSYMLVVHSETKESMEAGNLYIYLGVIGGLAILLGMILLYINTNSLEFLPMISDLEALGWMRYFIIILFITGFGVKAGMFPLHIWLPKAHPVAPTPASALLSGIMIKIGAYGILRTTTSYLFPYSYEISGFYDPLWLTSQNIGFVIIWLAIITMGLGVFLAMQQDNMKKMLAYSSVSQIGYVIMGIGVAIYLGHKGAMGFSGGIYHIINHALFKALLFMVAGSVYMQTHDLSLSNLGGLWRKMPVTALACFIAFLGITGVPGFNGFASKTILHHAIVEAYQYGHPSFRYAEILFTIISAGTLCTLLKLFVFTFLGELPSKFKNIKKGYPMMDMAMSGFIIIIVLIGLKPNYLLDTFIIPAARGITYDPDFINSYIVGLNCFTFSDLLGSAYAYIIGFGLFCIGSRFGLLNICFPCWMSIEYIFKYPAYRISKIIYSSLDKGYESTEAAAKDISNKILIKPELPSCDNRCNSDIAKDKKKSEDMEKKVDSIINAFKLLIRKYEMSFIKSDVVIYLLILTGILAGLIIFR